MDKRTSASKFLSERITANSLHLVASEPTNHTLWRIPTVHTWIDLFLVNDEEAINYYKKSSSPFAVGHDFIEIGYKCLGSSKKPKTFWARNLKNLDSDALTALINLNLERLCPSKPQSPNNPVSTVNNVNNFSPVGSVNIDMNVNNINTSIDVNCLLCSLSTAITSSFDAVAPLKKILSKPRKKPWVSPKIRTDMNWRDRAFKTARQTGLQPTFSNSNSFVAK